MCTTLAGSHLTGKKPSPLLVKLIRAAECIYCYLAQIPYYSASSEITRVSSQLASLC